MEQIMNDAFRVMQQGIAAINAAKTVETGTPATQPVSLPKPQTTTGGTNWTIIGGVAIAGLLAYLFFKKK